MPSNVEYDKKYEIGSRLICGGVSPNHLVTNFVDASHESIPTLQSYNYRPQWIALYYDGESEKRNPASHNIGDSTLREVRLFDPPHFAAILEGQTSDLNDCYDYTGEKKVPSEVRSLTSMALMATLK